MRRLCLIICGLLIAGASYAAGPSGGSALRYWKIGDDALNVWSLQDHALINTTNSVYLDWLASGYQPTQIANAADLYDVLAASYPNDLLAAAPSLDAIGLRPFQAFSWRRQIGLMIEYTGFPALNGRYAVDDLRYMDLAVGALLRCGSTAFADCPTPMPGNQTTAVYFDLDNTPHTLSIIQLEVIVLRIQDYVEQLQTQLALGLGGGTPAWPARTVTVP